MTKSRRSEEGHAVKGEGRRFYSLEDVKIAYNEQVVDLHAVINLRIKNLSYSASKSHDSSSESI